VLCKKIAQHQADPAALDDRGGGARVEVEDHRARLAEGCRRKNSEVWNSSVAI